MRTSRTSSPAGSCTGRPRRSPRPGTRVGASPRASIAATTRATCTGFWVPPGKAASVGLQPIDGDVDLALWGPKTGERARNRPRQQARFARALAAVGDEARAAACPEHGPQRRLLLRRGLLRGRKRQRLARIRLGSATCSRPRSSTRRSPLDTDDRVAGADACGVRSSSPGREPSGPESARSAHRRRPVASASIRLKSRLAETSRTQSATSR